MPYLLLPIASMACHGGPMKVKPASKHFLAKTGFSLSCPPHQQPYVCLGTLSYKSIARVYALAALLLCNLDYPISIKVCRGLPEIHGVR
jgi:hypothetical protein